jgi:hypothetical protein
MDKQKRATRRDCIELIQERKLKVGFLSIGGIDRLVIGGRAQTFRHYDEAYADLCALPFEEEKKDDESPKIEIGTALQSAS